MTENNLDALFNPKAVAIVGASGNEKSILAKPLRFMQDARFKGAIYPINPSRSEIGGLKCYPDLASLPTDIDLALIQVPAKLVLESIASAADRGAKAAIVLSAGFAEAGGDGVALQAELTQLAKERNIRVLGPNAQGLVYAPSGLMATFTAAGDRADADGPLAYIGQSGAVGGSVLDLAAESGCSVGAWAATGNQADLEVVEIAEYFAASGRFRALMLYMETVPGGDTYQRLLAEAAASGTRIVILTTGNSEAAKKAAESHTGAMLKDDTAFRLMSAKAGAVIVEDIPELIQVASSIPKQSAGDRIGIFTTSGATGSLAAGACEEAGLRIAALSDDTKKMLAAQLPAFASVENPVDVTAQFFNSGTEHTLTSVGKSFIECQEVDQLIVSLGMAAGDLALELCDQIATLAKEANKPVYFLWYAGQDRTVAARRRLRDEVVPAFDSVERLAKAAAAAATEPVAISAIPPASNDAKLLNAIPRGRIIEANAAPMLEHLGVPVPKGVLVESAGEAINAAAGLNEPFVVKLQSLTITHKTEVGGVQLGVTRSELETVVERMLAIEPKGCLGVLVQETAAKGRELIVGITRKDPSFPPLLTVGIGGTGVELYKDVSTRLLPVTKEEVSDMIAELRGSPLFNGFRGGAKYDLDAAAETITKIADGALSLGDRLKELEINPLFVHEERGGVTAVDVLAETDSG